MNHPPISSDALRLHRDALVWDMTLPIITPGSPERKQSLFRRAAAAGFDYISITLAVDLYDFRAAATELARHRSFVAEHGDIAVLADSTAAIGEARAAGKLAIGFSFQGTAPFESELGFVDLFYELGVRHALMAYNDQNLVGSGCHVAVDKGLTAYGRELVAEMNRVGMVVDCAHTGYRTTMETIEASTSPVIISHTNARALTDHPRCVRDDQIKACAGSGGVVGMTGLNIFLGGEATPRRLADHIDHVADLVGPEHVGLGLDYVYDLETFQKFTDGSPELYSPDANYSNMSQIELEDAPRITEELLARRYNETEVRGILGENWMRVCHQVWT